MADKDSGRAIVTDHGFPDLSTERAAAAACRGEPDVRDPDFQRDAGLPAPSGALC